MTFWQSCRKHGERILVNSSLLFLQESEKRSCHQVIEPAVGFIRVLPLLSGSGANRAATTKQTQNETLCCKALPLSCVQVLPSWCDDIIWARFRGSGTMVSGSHLSPTQEQSWALSDINLLPLEENKTTNRWRHMKAAACHQGELSHIHSLTDMLAVVLNTMVSYFNILLLWHHLFTLSPVCVCVCACLWVRGLPYSVGSRILDRCMMGGSCCAGVCSAWCWVHDFDSTFISFILLSLYFYPHSCCC